MKSIRSAQCATWLVLLALFASAEATRCFYKYSEMKKGILPNCVDGCRDYGSADAAFAECDKIDTCTGVSNTFKINGGANSIGPNGLSGWQLRSGSSLISDKYNQQDYTFLKEGSLICNQSRPAFGGPIFDAIVRSEMCRGSSCPIGYSTFQDALDYITKNSAAKVLAIFQKEGKWIPNQTSNLKGQDYGITFRVESNAVKEYVSEKYSTFTEQRGKTMTGTKAFSSYQAARDACNDSTTCIGITYSNESDQSSSVAQGIIQGYSYYISEGSVVNGRSNNIAWSKDKIVTTNAVPATQATPEATVTPGISATPTTNAANPTATTPTVTPGITTTPTTKAENPTTTTPAATVVECAEAFTECNYTGTSVKLCESDANFEWRKYKSLKIPSDKNAIIYGSDNYQGQSRVIKSSIACSIKLEEFLFSAKASKSTKESHHAHKLHHNN